MVKLEGDRVERERGESGERSGDSWGMSERVRKK